MVDRRPGLVMRAQVDRRHPAAVDFARKNDVLIAVRGGGHQIAGLAVADGALLLDLSLMRAVQVDPASATVRVEPGALLADLDGATQAYGLAVAAGINSTTGVAGLTLGGGFGWLTPQVRHDRRQPDLRRCRHRRRRAPSAPAPTENPDLFWAIRGGGGNFGVVASFEFRLHPVGPEVLAGLIVHPIERRRGPAAQLPRRLRRGRDELTVWAVLRKAPPLPFLPRECTASEVLVFAACYAGESPRASGAWSRCARSAPRSPTSSGRVPFAAWQQAFDPLLTPRRAQLLEVATISSSFRTAASR